MAMLFSPHLSNYLAVASEFNRIHRRKFESSQASDLPLSLREYLLIVKLQVGHAFYARTWQCDGLNVDSNSFCLQSYYLLILSRSCHG